MGHAGVLGPDETGVGGYGLPHTLDGAVRLSLELTSDDLTQALAQGVRLLAKLLAGLTPTVWEDEQTVAGDYRGGDNPRHVEETRRCDGTTTAPIPTAPTSSAAVWVTAPWRESASFSDSRSLS